MTTAVDAAAVTSTEIPNQVVIEDAGPAKKRLTITIPAESVNEKIDDSFSTLAGEAALPGFRKGKAPRKLIERRFGSSVMQETRNQLIADAYSKALEDHKIKAVGEPEGDDLKDVKVEPGKPLTFSVEVEVAPEFELPNLEGVKIRKPVVEVTDADVQAELDRQCYRFGEPEELTEAIGAGDRMQGRALVTKIEDGSVVEDLAEAVVAMPLTEDDRKGHVLGLFQEDMFALFGGKSVGDTVALEATISETHERPTLRGQKIKVEFTINRAVRVKRATPEGLVEMFGMDSVDTVRNEIRSALQQRAQQEQQAAMREQLAERLVATIDFPLPEKLSANQAQRVLERARLDMLYRGISPDEVEVRVAELRESSVEEARQGLKMFFILSRLAEQMSIEVSDQEINGRVAMLAAQRGVRPEQLRAQLAQEGRLQQIALQIREHKTLDRVLEKASVEEISAADWNKLVEQKRAERTGGAKPAPKGKGGGKAKK